MTKVERSTRKRPTTLFTASNAFEAWNSGDPGYEKEEVVKLYIDAETRARDLDKRRKTSFSRMKFTMERLAFLGVDPETLELVE